jgi:hypothetical protein
MMGGMHPMYIMQMCYLLPGYDIAKGIATRITAKEKSFVATI